MNEVIHQLYERKSVRVFEDREIPSEAKSAILRAATMAPTAGNQQLYTILDITDPEIKCKLADSCDHQPFIATAKLVLIFCADCLKWREAFCCAGAEPRKPGPGDLMLAVTDAAIAAQNAVVAAHSLGIGSCYIGDIMENCEIHREMLNLPEYVFPAAIRLSHSTATGTGEAAAFGNGTHCA
ncbi:MAG: nitroreductase family protein [Phascolarctobacterium sp.]|nr:nitroreductase family protein [Phascolarctobacterium sp.]